MVNTTQFYKTKVALAVVLSLGLAACGDSEGDAGSTSTSQTDAPSAGSETVNKATGSIQGVVLDTNGVAVVGATVTTAGQTAVTDASGSYVFDDVQVTNVAGADASTGHAPFVIVIQAPEGYASTATVNVTPNAQIDAANAQTTAIPLTTFVDGFLAQAGTAILPKKDSVIEGWIRNIDTGEAIEGAVLSLDFTGLSSTVVPGGANVALSGDLQTTTTGADGSYRFEGTYNDSVYNLSIQDYNFITSGSSSSSDNVADVSTVEAYSQAAATTSQTITTTQKVKAGSNPVIQIDGTTFSDFVIIDGVITTDDGSDILTGGEYVTVSYDYVVTTTTTTTTNGTSSQTSGSTPATTAEGVEINMGTQSVRMITSSDTIKPYVSGLVGWIETYVGNFAVMNEGVNQEFTLQFSEPVDATKFDADEVLITDSTSTILPGTAVLAADGRSVTVTLDTALEAGDKVEIFLPWEDLTDAGGNYFSVSANDTMDPAITFDSQITASSGKASFLRAQLCIFSPAVINPTGFAAEQAFNQSTTLDAGLASLNDYSNAFWDDQATTVDSDIRQLNGQANTALAIDLLAEEVSGAALTTDVDHAWVKVTLGEASSYGTNTGISGSTSSNLWFDGVEAGDAVKFTFNNDLGLAAGSTTVTLVDAVKPTTTLQENYTLPGTAGYTAKLVTTGALPTQGAGGEVTEVGVDATTGNPIIYVQPRHLTPTLANNTADTDEGAEFAALVDGVAARSETTTETPEAFTDTAGGTAHPIYDDEAFSAWTAADRANSMGVAFTENIALVASTTPIFSGAGVSLASFTALNNVDNNIDGLAHANGLTSEDLVRFEVSDMVALANDNHNTTLSFSGDIQDTAGNIADDNSQATVVFRDAMPPMVTDAVYTGTTLVLTFNEELGSRADLDDTDIVIDDLDTTADAAAVTLNLESSVTTTAAVTDVAYTISTDMKTLTLELGSIAATVNPLFEDGVNDEFLWEEDGNNLELESHASLNWDEIPDANGNAWASFDFDTVGATRYAVQAPRFYAYNDVGAFTVTYAYAGLAAGAGPDADGFTASITFSHPLDFGSVAPAAKTTFVEKSDGDNNDVYFENVADIQRLLVLDLNANGDFDAADAFPAGTTAAWINSNGTTRLDLVVPAGMSVVYGTSVLVFASDDAVVTSSADLTAGDTYVAGDAVH
ncbi:MAG: carboxypeptidase-like regulatory domain-containing protein [Paraglaciecola sp.]|uniref:carboxypeptidase-like regulatory domain-containing protein n=1 Tax=Paraglaciecola sp. TaxID=1920173 RepID=UPI003298A457